MTAPSGPATVSVALMLLLSACLYGAACWTAAPTAGDDLFVCARAAAIGSFVALTLIGVPKTRVAGLGFGFGTAAITAVPTGILLVLVVLMSSAAPGPIGVAWLSLLPAMHLTAMIGAVRASWRRSGHGQAWLAGLVASVFVMAALYSPLW